MDSGIYMIKNTVNNKVYIGQTKAFKYRWQQHKSDLRNNRHHNKHLQFAWFKYGEDVFTFEIIEECPIESLNEKEKYWIQYYNSNDSTYGYNSDCGGQGISGYVHTEEEICKMRRIKNPHIVLQFDPNFNFVNEWIGGVSHIYLNNEIIKHIKNNNSGYHVNKKRNTTVERRRRNYTQME